MWITVLTMVSGHERQRKWWKIQKFLSLQEKVWFIHLIQVFHVWYGDKLVIFSAYCYMKQFCKIVLCVAGLEGKTYTFFVHRVGFFVWWFLCFLGLKSLFFSVFVLVLLLRSWRTLWHQLWIFLSKWRDLLYDSYCIQSVLQVSETKVCVFKYWTVAV